MEVEGAVLKAGIRNLEKSGVVFISREGLCHESECCRPAHFSVRKMLGRPVAEWSPRQSQPRNPVTPQLTEQGARLLGPTFGLRGARLFGH